MNNQQSIKGVSMDRGSTIILRAIICFMGAGALAICVLALPAGLLTDNVGYYRPILLGLYLPAIAFIYALYQAFKLLNLIDQNQAFSTASILMLKRIKYCALVVSGLFVLGSPYILYAAERDDAPGVMLIAMVIIFASFVVAVAAAVFQKLLQNAVDLKSENDLTV